MHVCWGISTGWIARRWKIPSFLSVFLIVLVVWLFFQGVLVTFCRALRLRGKAFIMKLAELAIFKYPEPLASVVLACVEKYTSGREADSCPDWLQQIVPVVILSSTSNSTDSSNSSSNSTNSSSTRTSAAGGLESCLLSFGGVESCLLFVWSPSLGGLSPSEPPWRRRRIRQDWFRLSQQALVMGTDTAGRLNEEAVIRWWKDLWGHVLGEGGVLGVLGS